VINLEHSTARLQHMRSVLGAAQIAFTRIEAVDARKVASHPAYRLIPTRQGRTWVAGEVACLLSHYNVWTEIARSTEGLAAVFEDDLHIDARLRDVLRAGAIPADADIVKLETFNVPVAISRSQASGPSGVAFARLHSLHSGSAAYVISRAAAQRATHMLSLFDLPVDDAIFEPLHPVGRAFRKYQVIPALAIQDNVLPTHTRAPELASLIEPERILQSAQASRGNRRGLDRLRPLRNLPARLVRAVWRRVGTRLTKIPYSGASVNPGKQR
jgi:glycosyl transferase family 25